MSTVAGTLLPAVGAFLACASWLVDAAGRASAARPYARAIAGWAGLSLAAVLLEAALGPAADQAAMAVLIAAAVSGVIGVAGLARPATVTPGLAQAAAEAVLVGSSLVSVFWVVAGSPAWPGARAVLALTLTTIDVTAAALIVRVPAATPAVVPDDRYRRVVRGGVVAICVLGAADGLMTLDHLGIPVPGWLPVVVRAAAYLAAAAVPWIGPSAVAPPARTSRAAHALPYALVAAAVGAHLVAAFAGRVGPVSIALVAIVVSALAAVQGLALRENARLMRDLRTSRARLEALVENAGDVILGIDVTGRVVSANAAASRLLHRAPSAMRGLDVAELAVVADRPALRSVVEGVVSGRQAAGRVELRLAAPATGTAELRLRGVDDGAVANLSDVTDAVQLRDRLARLARFDEMTGLANRSHLLDEVGGWLRAGRTVHLLYADLDGFKAVNDRFGHLHGDGVLVEAARRLHNALGGLPSERILLARMGGDEFVVAVSDARPEDLAVATDRMLAAMRPTFAVADRAVRVGLSIGVASSGDPLPPSLDPTDAGDLLHRADVAMFAAKQAGRFRVRRWDPAMEARAQRRVDIAIGLRRALDSGRLALAYQPLVRLSDGVVIGLEALVRVAGGDDAPGALAGLPELVSPAELVAVAEDTDEITEMGQWVLGEATHRAADWRDLGHDVQVTVNVSVRQMAADGFIASVEQALKEAGLPPGALIVEITEGQLLSEQDPAWQAVGELRAMGVVLMIDDFGSGYSSLAYLRHMPVRGVKLDRALLDDLTTDPRARTLARAVIGAARALGLLVIAEGLETLQSARIVRDLGAFAGQGFALYQAMPADAVPGMLAARPVSLGSDLPGDAGPRAVAAAAPRAVAASARPSLPTSGPWPDPAPVDPAPVDPAPVDPAPVDPAPVDPAPVDPAPVDPAPVDPAPVDPAPVDPAPVDRVDLTAIDPTEASTPAVIMHKRADHAHGG